MEGAVETFGVSRVLSELGIGSGESCSGKDVGSNMFKDSLGNKI